MRFLAARLSRVVRTVCVLVLACLLLTSSASSASALVASSSGAGEPGAATVYAITVVPLQPDAATQVGYTGTANYLVSNTSTSGSTALTIHFVLAGCIGSLTGCVPPADAALGPGQSTIVWARFGGTSQMLWPQPLLLQATSTAADGSLLSATATVSASVIAQTAQQQAVSVRSWSGNLSSALGTSGTAQFVVQNTSTSQASQSPLMVNLTQTCAAPSLGCPPTQPSISLPGGAAQLVGVNYTGQQYSSTSQPITLRAQISGVAGSDTTPKHRYRFAPSAPFVDDYGGPQLAGSGITDQAGYHFNGLSGPVASGVLTSGAVYTIVMDFTLANLQGDEYQQVKLIDFKDRTSDHGLYVTGPAGMSNTVGALLLYDENMNRAGPAGFSMGTNHLVLTRTAAGMVTAYVNGTQIVQQLDPTSTFVFDHPGNVIHFFQDDLAIAPIVNELASGAVQSIMLYDRALSAAEVSALAASSIGSVGVLVTGGPPPPLDNSIKVIAASRTLSVQAGAQGTATYAIQNTSTAPGSLLITFAISGCPGGISCVAPPGPISLAAGASLNVTTTFNATQQTLIPVYLTLTAFSNTPARVSSDSIAVAVIGPPPPAPMIAVGAPSGSPVTIPNAGSGAMSFSINNQAVSDENLTFSVSCGTLASCSAWPAAQTLLTRVGTTVWVYFTAAPSQSGTYPVTLTVTGRGGSNSATGQVIVQPGPVYSLSVTPTPASVTTQQGSSGMASYVVKNTSTNSVNAIPIGFSVGSCPAAIAPCGGAPAPISLPAGASQTVDVPYFGTSVSSSVPLTLTASFTYAPSATGTVNVAVTPAPVYRISVTPRSSTGTVVQGTSGSSIYTVKNTSTNSSGLLAIILEAAPCPSSIRYPQPRLSESRGRQPSSIAAVTPHLEP